MRLFVDKDEKDMFQRLYEGRIKALQKHLEAQPALTASMDDIADRIRTSVTLLEESGKLPLPASSAAAPAAAKPAPKRRTKQADSDSDDDFSASRSKLQFAAGDTEEAPAPRAQSKPVAKPAASGRGRGRGAAPAARGALASALQLTAVKRIKEEIVVVDSDDDAPRMLALQ